MTPMQLASLAAYAGDWRDRKGPYGPYPFSPCVPVHVRKAVYLVCGWSGRILYVGSTIAGVRTRFAQHLRDVTKTLDWTTVYIFPLTDDTPLRDVRRIEGRIGLAAGPERNKSLPSITTSC